MPYDATIVAASTSRILNAAGPPRRSGPERMSGVLGQKLGRMKSAFGPWQSSSRYSRSSHLAVRHVK